MSEVTDTNPAYTFESEPQPTQYNASYKVL